MLPSVLEEVVVDSMLNLDSTIVFATLKRSRPAKSTKEDQMRGTIATTYRSEFVVWLYSISLLMSCSFMFLVLMKALTLSEKLPLTWSSEMRELW